MELLTADDAGEVVIYECPDCGYQVESPVEADEDEPLGHRDPDEDLPGGADDDATADPAEPKGEP